MAININALKAAAAKVGQLGQDELTFDTGQAEVTIRPLKAHEELAVEKYGQGAWDEASGDEDRSALADYLDRMRTMTLAFTIVQIDDVDLRGEDFIETGEVDDNGTPIKRPRHEVVRELIREWNRHILHLCYLKYAELMTKVELKAGKAIHFDTKDTDSEITRLQNRIDELYKLKEEATESQTTATQSVEVRNAIKGLGEAHEERVEKLKDATEKVEEYRRSQTQHNPDDARRAAAQQASPPAPPRQEVSYPPMQDPEAVGEQPQMESRPRRSPVPNQAPPPPRQSAPQQSAETDEMGIPVPHEGDSMFDPADGDAAMHAEHRRQLEYRRRMQQSRQSPQQDEQAAEVPTIPPEQAPPTGRKPPHRDALNTADAVMTFEDGQPVSARPKGAKAEVQGYRLPTETLSDRTRGQGVPPARGTKAPVNQPPKGSKNPRFRGPQQ